MISIVIPCYNSENTIIRCLESIQNQTFSNFETIIIDDGSTDDSYDLVKEFSLSDSRFSIYSFSNHGVSWARNKGIELAKGEFIIFCDSDDYLENTMLSEMYAVRNMADLVLVGIEAYDVKSKKKLPMLFGNEKLDKNDFLFLLQSAGFSPFFGGPYNKLYSIDIIKEHKLRFNKNQSFAEDFCFNIDYFDKCNSFFVISRLLYNYEFNQSNSLTNYNYSSLNYEIFLQQAMHAVDSLNLLLNKNNISYTRNIYVLVWRIFLSKLSKYRNINFFEILKIISEMYDLFDIRNKIKNSSANYSQDRLNGIILSSKFGSMAVFLIAYLKNLRK